MVPNHQPSIGKIADPKQQILEVWENAFQK